jgi:alpha-beta hydrolase superfamily lysophospholipase
MSGRVSDSDANEGFAKSVMMPTKGGGMIADWVMPPDALGIVLFAHGSGSSRHSSRNKAVARYLQERGMGTFLLDLLTPEEEKTDLITREHRFDIPLLSRRLADATRWLRTQPEAKHLPLAYFGASTGAAAALIAAARLPREISSVVSRGGRPDLAGDIIIRVASPTLLLVGGRDDVVIELNRKAMEKMRAPRELVIIPGATHLFEEPGTLEEVARRAADWFLAHFPQPVTQRKNLILTRADARRCE